jgi:hypothetical protein
MTPRLALTIRILGFATISTAAFGDGLAPPTPRPDWRTQAANQDAALYGWVTTGAGDVNGDGWDDVVVSALGYRTAVGEVGRLYVFHGSRRGLRKAPASVIDGTQPNAMWGEAVAPAGDVNGDGYDDLIVGAPQHSNGQQVEGRAYVYLGSPGGLDPVPVWTTEHNQKLTYYGTSVGPAGDVNGDGYDDVVVGSPYHDGNRGAAFLYHGSPTGPSPTPAWVAVGDEVLGEFGRSIAGGMDSNGDGHLDLAVGAPFRGSARGAVFVFLGTASGFPAQPSWIADGASVGTNHFGWEVARGGDVEGDGYDDLLVGAPLDGTGAAFLYRGSSTGPGASPVWSVTGTAIGERLGEAIGAIGDRNGDGYDDVVIGAPWYSNGQIYEGRILVYDGSASGLPGTPSFTAESNGTTVLYCVCFGDSARGAGDVNGDGYDDLVVGAPYDSQDQTEEGQAVGYLGGP